MVTALAALLLVLLGAEGALAQNYLGNLSANPYAPKSTSNPFGRCGNPFSPDSINNRFGAGNRLAPDSPTNPYGSGWRIIGQ